jgi:hypothetical protein
MAWIPRPCGEVDVIGTLEEVGREGRWDRGIIMKVSCRWRQRAAEPIVGGRLAGMLSELNATLLSGQDAEA